MTRTILLAAAAAAVLCAQEAKKPVAKPAAPGQGGMMVYRDPATGELRQTPVPGTESSATATVTAPASQPQITVSPNGTVSAVLGPEFQTFAVVRLNANGKLDMQCVTGEKAANAAVKQAAPKEKK